MDLHVRGRLFAFETRPSRDAPMAVACAVHRTLQASATQVKDGGPRFGSLAQHALWAMQRAAQWDKACAEAQAQGPGAAHSPPAAPIAARLPKRVPGTLAQRLEAAVPAYMATLCGSDGAGAPCILAQSFVQPCQNALRDVQPRAPKALVTVVDLQNMLLQATWQPSLWGTWGPAVRSLAAWAGYVHIDSDAARLFARRMLTRTLVANLIRLWQGLQVAAPPYIAALAERTLLSEICDYDVLRRSVTGPHGALCDVAQVRANLARAYETPGLSPRAALQLRMLAHRLAVFDMAAGASEALLVTRFAQLGPVLKAASTQVADSEDATCEAVLTPAPVMPAPQARALQHALALCELYPATVAYRRGIPDAPGALGVRDAATRALQRCTGRIWPPCDAA